MNRQKLLVAAVGLACLVSTPLTAKDPAKVTVLFDREFRLLSPDGEKQLGTWEIKAVLNEADKRIEIVESMSMGYRGQKAGYTSTVTYVTEPGMAPLSGATETTINGKACMKGTVTLAEKTISYECTGLLNKKTGEVIDPPKKYENTLPRPEGTILFQSALAAVAPRLLPQAGELTNVVFAEFPDDLGAPELITLKPGYRLVREAPNADGQYIIKLYAAGAEEEGKADVLSQIHYDKDGRMLFIDAFGKLKLVPAETTSKPAATASAPASAPA